jgi:hypothetical protein
MSYRFLVFSVVALQYLAVLNARPDFTRFNCHDSESYVALAWDMAHGQGRFSWQAVEQPNN